MNQLRREMSYDFILLVKDAVDDRIGLFASYYFVVISLKPKKDTIWPIFIENHRERITFDAAIRFIDEEEITLEMARYELVLS